MSNLLNRCAACGQYTLLATCPQCGGGAANPHPAKYSPDDKLAKYRRVGKFGN